MTDNVVHLKSKEEKFKEQRTEELLDVVDTVRNMIINGSITEFAAVSLDNNGEVAIHVSALDSVAAIGMYEIGKALLMERNIL